MLRVGVGLCSDVLMLGYCKSGPPAELGDLLMNEFYGAIVSRSTSSRGHPELRPLSTRRRPPPPPYNLIILSGRFDLQVGRNMCDV